MSKCTVLWTMGGYKKECTVFCGKNSNALVHTYDPSKTSGKIMYVNIKTT